MNKRYHYDSREHHQPLNRQRRFAAFVFVLCTLSFAFNLAYVYTYEWDTGEDKFTFWQVALAAIMIGLALFLIAILVAKAAKIGYADYQLLEVDDQGITWHLSKRKGKQSLTFSEIQYAKTDPRHLILKLKNGEEVWLENYLIEDRETEWDQFVAAVGERIAVK